MKSEIFTSFLILALILVFPQVNAQLDSFEKVIQKLVQVTIDLEGNVSVAHQIKESGEPRQLNFVDGTVSNLKFIDEFGRVESIDASKYTDNIVILPERGEVFVKYDLDDALFLKNSVWTLDFRYLQTTNFILPEEVDLVFVNQKPVLFDEKKGFACHGCQLLLEYSINEPKNIKQVNWEDKEFLVEVRTLAGIESFDFNQPLKKISFRVNDDNRFVTAIIPLELLWKPYSVFLDDKKIWYHEYINNGTHVWLSMKPATSGEITIIGTTVIPEFPIIAPLAVGFLMILVVPLMRKFNLR
jgi:hypothetical protein